MITRLSSWLAFALAFAWLASAAPARAQDAVPHDICQDSCCLTDVLLLNTGYDHLAGQPYTIGDRDGFWQVVVDPDGGTVPRATDVVDPNTF